MLQMSETWRSSRAYRILSPLHLTRQLHSTRWSDRTVEQAAIREPQHIWNRTKSDRESARSDDCCGTWGRKSTAQGVANRQLACRTVSQRAWHTCRETCDSGLQDWAMRCFTWDLLWEREETVLLCARVRNELRRPEVHAEQKVKVVYGVKPHQFQEGERQHPIVVDDGSSGDAEPLSNLLCS